jgi:UDP-2,3-diacylglucosamine hydrolase
VPAPPSRVIVIADAHLGQVPPSTTAAFHEFLAAVPDLGDHLVINGDLFDFWFEWGSVIPRKHFDTVARLAQLRGRGLPITFIGGNHDRWGGAFLRDDLGIDYHRERTELSLAGRHAFVAHGDGLTEQHWSAVLLHRLTRHPAIIATFRALHPTIGYWIVDQMSGHLGDNTRNPALLDRAEHAQAEYARRLLEQRGELGLVILAHTHRARLDTLPDGRAYLNPGAWLDGYRYAVVTSDGVELTRFTVPG